MIFFSLDTIYTNISVLSDNDTLLGIINSIYNIALIINSYFDHVNLLHFIHDQVNNLISLKDLMLIYIKDIYIYIYDSVLCFIFDFYHYYKDLYLGILLKALNYLGLIFLIISLKLLIICNINTLLNSDDESASIPTNQVGLSTNNNSNKGLMLPPPRPGDNGPVDPNNVWGEEAGAILTALWYLQKRRDIKNENPAYSDEDATNMSNESAKKINVISSPSNLYESFTYTDGLSILHENKLFHVDSKYYNVLDDKYDIKNVLESQDVRNVYGSSSGTVEIILRFFLLSNNRMALTGDEPRPYTLDVWGANLDIDPPYISGLPNAVPSYPCEGASLDNITDPYIDSAVRVIISDVYPQNALDTIKPGFNNIDVIDEKKLTDLKYIFLFYKEAGNTDLSWEKVVELYALTYKKGYYPIQGSHDSSIAYMKMIDFVEMMDNTRKASFFSTYRN